MHIKKYINNIHEFTKSYQIGGVELKFSVLNLVISCGALEKLMMVLMSMSYLLFNANTQHGVASL